MVKIDFFILIQNKLKRKIFKDVVYFKLIFIYYLRFFFKVNIIFIFLFCLKIVWVDIWLNILLYFIFVYN